MGNNITFIFRHLTMIFREATVDDIKQIQIVRNSVKENALSDPNLVTDQDCNVFMFQRGKGWVCEIDNTVVGFAIADLVNNNIWALFLHPNHEHKGIGRKLHDMMLDWYFSKQDNVWLGTAPGTRAELFYQKSGWRKAGMYGKETKFEMTAEEWKSIKQTRKTMILGI
ncbi:ribosomal protein S18 acetylase RimI-like enzyme [Arcticibacter tournemirensis]|nr:GNAT family N-acetyltransferase [Arcticibacter tournemirensis]TQM48490.1 ribosomal protein S18 acetylase RimI-like enzyme [Arcticibacter tournemirensis]